jgi:hypothetical protein
MGVELALEEGNLRPTFSDGLILQIEGVRVGDLERADRLDVSSVVISWSWKELFTLHLPPQSIEVGKLLLRPSLDENGALVVVALRPSPERAEPADSKPLQWPLSELFLPSDGATCLYDFGQIEVELPNGFEYGGGAAAALDDLQWTFSRTGETVTLVGGARVRHSEVPLLRLKTAHTLNSATGSLTGEVSSEVGLAEAIKQLLPPTLPLPVKADLLENQFTYETALTALGNSKLTGQSRFKKVSEALGQSEFQPWADQLELVWVLTAQGGANLPETMDFVLKTTLTTGEIAEHSAQVSIKADLIARQALITEELYSPDLAPFLALYPLEGIGILPGNLRSSLGFEVSWADLSISNLRAEASGGLRETDPTTLSLTAIRVPHWQFSLAGDAAWKDWLTASLEAVVEVALPGDAEAARTELTLETEAASDVLSARFETRGWNLEALATYLPEAIRPELSGLLEVALGARFAQVENRLEGADLRFRSSALNVRLPQYMAHPLAFAPIDLEAEVGRNLESAQVSPFQLASNWFALGSEGISWKSEAGAMQGAGALDFAVIRVGPILDDLLPEVVRHYQLETARELSLGPIRLDFSMLGESLETARGQLRVDGEVSNPAGHLPWQLEAEVGLAALDWAVTFGFEGLNETQWRALAPRDLPIPGLNAPIDFHAEASGPGPEAIDAVRWRVAIGAGTLEPREMLSPWLQQPVPIDSFVLAGSLERSLSLAVIDELELKMGRGRLAFERLELNSEDPLYSTTDLDLSVQLGFSMENWYLNDWLDYLVPELVAALPADPREMGLVGLESFRFTTQVAFSQDTAGNLEWRELRSGGEEAILRVGERRYPMALALNLEPNGKSIGATASLNGARLDRLGLHGPLDQYLDMLAFPLNLEIGVEAPAAMRAGMAGGPRARLRVAGGEGEILPGEFLGASVPLAGWELRVGARLDELLLDEMSFFADLQGPRLSVQEVEFDGPLGAGPIGGELRVKLEDFPLEWAWVRVPDVIKSELIPAAFRPSDFSGALDHLDLRARFLVDPEAPGPESLRSFQLDLQATDLGLRPGNYPRLDLASLTVAGETGEVRLEIDEAGLEGGRLEHVSVRVREPLQETRSASVEGRLVGDGAQLGRTLLSTGDLLPSDVVKMLMQLPSSVSLNFAAEVPQLSNPDPAALAATADLAWNASLAPGLIPNVPVAGDLTGDMALTWQGGALKIKGSSTVANFVYANQFAGAPRFEWQAESDLQTATIRFDGDLTEMAIKLPPLGWSKPRGKSANVTFGAKVGDGLLPGETPQQGAFQLRTSGLVLQQSDVAGRWLLDFAEAQPWGGLRQVSLDRLNFDGSALQAELNLPTADTIDFRLWGSRLDLAAFGPLLEDLAFALAPDSEAPRASETPEAPVEEAVLGRAETPPAESPLLRLSTDVQIDEVRLSEDRSLRGFQAGARVRGPVLEAASFGFDYGLDTLRFALTPRGDGTPMDGGEWTFFLADVASLLDYSTAPFRGLSEEARAANPTFALLAEAPAMILGGVVSAEGTLRQPPEGPILDSSLKVENLVLVKDIPLLTRLSRLVDKEVKLGVAFSRFEWDRIHLEPTRVALTGGFLDGPIDLTFEQIDFDLERSFLEMKGKVFGACYEVVGELGSLEPYLCESTILTPVLSSDEFDWGGDL